MATMARTKKLLQEAKEQQKQQCTCHKQSSQSSPVSCPAHKNPNAKLHRLRSSDPSVTTDLKGSESPALPCAGQGGFAGAADCVGATADPSRDFHFRNCSGGAGTSASSSGLLPGQPHLGTSTSKDQSRQQSCPSAGNSCLPLKHEEECSPRHSAVSSIPLSETEETSRGCKNNPAAAVPDCRTVVLPEGEDSQQVSVFPTVKEAVQTLPKLGERHRVPIVLLSNDVKVKTHQPLNLSPVVKDKTRSVGDPVKCEESEEEMDVNIFEKFQQEMDLLNPNNKTPGKTPPNQKVRKISESDTEVKSFEGVKGASAAGDSLVPSEKKSPRQRSPQGSARGKKSPPGENAHTSPPAGSAVTADQDSSPPQGKRTSRLPSGSPDTPATEVSPTITRGGKRLSRPSCRITDCDMVYPRLAGRRDSVGASSTTPSAKQPENSVATKSPEEVKLASAVAAKQKSVKSVIDSCTVNPGKLEKVIAEHLSTTKMNVINPAASERKGLDIQVKVETIKTEKTPVAESSFQGSFSSDVDLIMKQLKPQVVIEKSSSKTASVTSVSSLSAQKQYPTQFTRSVPTEEVSAEDVSNVLPIDSPEVKNELSVEKPAATDNLASGVEQDNDRDTTETAQPDSQPDTAPTTDVSPAIDTPTSSNVTLEHAPSSSEQNPSVSSECVPDSAVSPSRTEDKPPVGEAGREDVCARDLPVAEVPDPSREAEAAECSRLDVPVSAPEPSPCSLPTPVSTADDKLHQSDEQDSRADEDSGMVERKTALLQKEGDVEKPEEKPCVQITEAEGNSMSQQSIHECEDAQTEVKAQLNEVLLPMQGNTSSLSCDPPEVQDIQKIKPKTSECEDSEIEGVQKMDDLKPFTQNQDQIEQAAEAGESPSVKPEEKQEEKPMTPLRDLSDLISDVQQRVTDEARKITDPDSMIIQLFGAELHGDSQSDNSDPILQEDSVCQQKDQEESTTELEAEKTRDAKEESLTVKPKSEPQSSGLKLEEEDAGKEPGQTGVSGDIKPSASTANPEDHAATSQLPGTSSGLEHDHLQAASDETGKSGSSTPSLNMEVTPSTSEQSLSVQTKLQQLQEKASTSRGSSQTKTTVKRRLPTKEPSPLDVLSSVEMPSSKMSPFLSNSLDAFLSNPQNRVISQAKQRKLNDDGDSVSLDSFSSGLDDFGAERRQQSDSSSTMLRKSFGDSEAASSPRPSNTSRQNVAKQTCERADEDSDDDEEKKAREEEDKELQKLEPDFDEVDNVLFLSFPSEEAMTAHVSVVKTLKWDKDPRTLVGICRIIEFEHLKDEDGNVKTTDSRLHGLRGQHMRWKKYQRLFRQQIRIMRRQKAGLPVESLLSRRKTSSKTNDPTKIKGWKKKLDASVSGKTQSKGGPSEDLFMHGSGDEECHGMEWTMEDYEEPLYNYSSQGSEEEEKLSEREERARRASEHKRMMKRRRMFFKLHNTTAQDQYILRKLGGQAASNNSKKKKKNGELSTRSPVEDFIFSGKPGLGKPIKCVELDEDAVDRALSMLRDPVSYAEEMGCHSLARGEDSKDERMEMEEGDDMVMETVDESLDNSGLEAEEESNQSWRDGSSQAGRCDKPGCRYGCICHLCSVPAAPDPERSENEASRTVSTCNKEYCTLGCICDSLTGPSLKETSSHCGQPECMIECHCPTPYSLPTPEAPSITKDEADTNDKSPPHMLDLYSPERFSSEGKAASGGGTRPKPPKTDRYSNLPRRKSTYRVAKNLDAISRKALLLYETSEMYCEKKKRKSTDIPPSPAPSAPPRTTPPKVQELRPAKKPAATASKAKSKSSKVNLQWDPVVISDDEEDGASMASTSSQDRCGSSLDEKIQRRESTSRSRSNSSPTLERSKPAQAATPVSVCDAAKDVSPEVSLEASELTSAMQQVFPSPLCNDSPNPLPTPCPPQPPSSHSCSLPHLSKRLTSSSPQLQLKPGSPALQVPMPAIRAAENLHGWQSQMVCLKSNMPDEDDRIILLEFISNCEWERDRPQVLNNLSHFLQEGGYPTPTKFCVDSLDVEILPKADKPHEVPQEMNCNLPKTCNLPEKIFAIRIKVSLKDPTAGPYYSQVTGVACSERCGHPMKQFGQDDVPAVHPLIHASSATEVITIDDGLSDITPVPSSSPGIAPCSMGGISGLQNFKLVPPKMSLSDIHQTHNVTASSANQPGFPMLSSVVSIASASRADKPKRKKVLQTSTQQAAAAATSSGEPMLPVVTSAVSLATFADRSSNKKKRKRREVNPLDGDGTQAKKRKSGKEQVPKSGADTVLAMPSGVGGQGPIQLKLVQLPEGTQPGAMVHLLPRSAVSNKGLELSQLRTLPLATLLQRGVKLPMVKMAAESNSLTLAQPGVIPASGVASSVSGTKSTALSTAATISYAPMISKPVTLSTMASGKNASPAVSSVATVPRKSEETESSNAMPGTCGPSGDSASNVGSFVAVTGLKRQGSPLSSTELPKSKKAKPGSLTGSQIAAIFKTQGRGKSRSGGQITPPMSDATDVLGSEASNQNATLVNSKPKTASASLRGQNALTGAGPLQVAVPTTSVVVPWMDMKGKAKAAVASGIKNAPGVGSKAHAAAVAAAGQNASSAAGKIKVGSPEWQNLPIPPHMTVVTVGPPASYCQTAFGLVSRAKGAGNTSTVPTTKPITSKPLKTEVVFTSGSTGTVQAESKGYLVSTPSTTVTTTSAASKTNVTAASLTSGQSAAVLAPQAKVAGTPLTGQNAPAKPAHAPATGSSPGQGAALAAAKAAGISPSSQNAPAVNTKANIAGATTVLSSSSAPMVSVQGKGASVPFASNSQPAAVVGTQAKVAGAPATARSPTTPYVASTVRPGSGAPPSVQKSAVPGGQPAASSANPSSQSTVPVTSQVRGTSSLQPMPAGSSALKQALTSTPANAALSAGQVGDKRIASMGLKKALETVPGPSTAITTPKPAVVASATGALSRSLPVPKKPAAAQPQTTGQELVSGDKTLTSPPGQPKNSDLLRERLLAKEEPWHHKQAAQISPASQTQPTAPSLQSAASKTPEVKGVQKSATDGQKIVPPGTPGAVSSSALARQVVVEKGAASQKTAAQKMPPIPPVPGPDGDKASAAKSNQPTGQPAQPGQKPNQPAAKTNQPAAKSVAPAVKSNQPGATSVAPAMKSNQPAQKASQPTVQLNLPVQTQKSSQPAVKLNQPTQKPSQPGVKSNQPVGKADQPAPKSALPAQKPVTPAQKSNQPAERPNQPAHKPSQPKSSTPAQGSAGTSVGKAATAAKAAPAVKGASTANDSGTGKATPQAASKGKGESKTAVSSDKAGN